MNRNAQTSRQLTSHVFSERQARGRKTLKRALGSVSLARFYRNISASRAPLTRRSSVRAAAARFMLDSEAKFLSALNLTIAAAFLPNRLAAYMNEIKTFRPGRGLAPKKLLSERPEPHLPILGPQPHPVTVVLDANLL